MFLDGTYVVCQYFCTTAADHPGTDFYSRDPADPAVNGHRSARTSHECIQRCSSGENEHFVSKIGRKIFPKGATTWLAGSHLLPPARIQNFLAGLLVVDDTVPPAQHIDARLLRRRQVFRCESFKPILARSHKALYKVVFRTRHPQGEQSGHGCKIVCG